MFFCANGGSAGLPKATLPTIGARNNGLAKRRGGGLRIARVGRALEEFDGDLEQRTANPSCWVQGLPFAEQQALARSPAEAPVSDDLKGCVGVHQASEERLLPALPSASTATGNRIALPIEAIFGSKPFWLAWFQRS